MAEDFTYQTKVYHERGGNAQVARSDGIIRGHSGGIMSAESGYNFTLASQAILAKDMARVVHSRNDPYPTICAAAVSTALSEVNLPQNVRYVDFSGTSTLLNGLFWLTACSAGAEVFIRFGTSDTSNGSTGIFVSLSGCTLLGSRGEELSSFSAFISGSVTGPAFSYAMVHLIAPVDNTWAIVDQFGDINEKPL
jgi:hypothetical protein